MLPQVGDVYVFAGRRMNKVERVFPSFGVVVMRRLDDNKRFCVKCSFMQSHMWRKFPYAEDQNV